MKPSDYIKRGWTQGTCARDAEGFEVDVTSKQATCWCAFGALLASNRSRAGDVRFTLENHLGQHLAKWNDTPGRTQAEVIAALEAIGE